MTGLGSPEETTGEVLFDEAQLRRLREELQARAPRGAAPVAGKILIVASEPNTLPDMLNLLRQVPGVTLAPALEQGRRPRVELGCLAQICLDEDLRIDLIQLPAVDSHRPIWAIAGHGALGTLFLLSGPVGESAERVQEVSRVLKNTPRARVLHVVMLRRKERISPDELRENLSLIDESSLFLLPLESGKSPTALMRSLLSRVVP